MSPSTVRMDGRPGPRHSGPPCDLRRKAEGRGPGVRKVTAARTPWPLLAHPSSLPPSLSSPLSTCRVPRGLGIAVHWCVTVYAAGAGWLGSSGPLAQRGEFRDRAWGSLPVRGPARLEFEGAAGEGQEGSPGQCHVRRHPVPLPQAPPPAQCPDGSWASPFWGPHYRQVLCHLDLRWPLCRGLLAFVMFQLCS